MCIGLPMQVVEPHLGPGVALCAAGEQVRVVTISLVEPVTTGQFVLVHVDTALRTLDPQEAELITKALQGLERAERGEDFADMFADLDREPQLPAHLRLA
jgi:hydrogenase expression/formation protein HypC